MTYEGMENPNYLVARSRPSQWNGYEGSGKQLTGGTRLLDLIVEETNEC